MSARFFLRPDRWPLPGRGHGRNAPGLARQVGWLLLCWLLVQGWGHWHRSAHALAHAATLQPAVVASASVPADPADHPAGDLLCTWLDHLALGDTAPWSRPPEPVPSGLDQPLALRSVGGAGGQALLPYQARAPPGLFALA